MAPPRVLELLCGPRHPKRLSKSRFVFTSTGLHLLTTRYAYGKFESLYYKELCRSTTYGRWKLISVRTTARTYLQQGKTSEVPVWLRGRCWPLFYSIKHMQVVYRSSFAIPFPSSFPSYHHGLEHSCSFLRTAVPGRLAITVLHRGTSQVAEEVQSIRGGELTEICVRVGTRGNGARPCVPDLRQSKHASTGPPCTTAGRTTQGSRNT